MKTVSKQLSIASFDDDISGKLKSVQLFWIEVEFFEMTRNFICNNDNLKQPAKSQFKNIF